MSRKTIQPNWREQAEAARQRASALPPGAERDALIKQARQLETASQMNEWLTSPGLQPPT
jgi:hypothetical protein